ncbi:MAG: aminopeptidase [Calditrichaeota bacterium]|nr:aminopeptidase [Calditrichota bacterium]
MDALHEAALVAARDCMGIQNHETVLIVTDTPTRKIGQALFDVCTDLCQEVFMLEMIPRQTNGEEPPEPVAEMMKMVDVVIAPTRMSITHTNARRNACKAGTRVGTMPGITEEVMIRTMRADYHRVARLTYQVRDILNKGKIAHLTSPKGTDIVIPIEGISAIASTGLILERGTFGNLPSGEAYLMPEEGKAEGVFVVDGSMAGIGLIHDQPIRITVEKGKAVKIEGGTEARQLEAKINEIGDLARNLAELGVGTNYMAKITGKILEDEKVLGTVHLALGNNVSMGGTVNVPFHVDGVIQSPTLKIDDQVLLENGKLMV